MCGIIGFTGRKPAKDILIDGLERLEYRGYDSAGIALLNDDDTLTIRKKAGRVSELRELCKDGEYSSTCGIGHTRWATHGGVTDANAHPHRCGNVALIHNGIIENYSDIIREYGLADKLVSETDSEVVAALLDTLYEGDPITAIRKVVKIIAGSFALCIMFADRPGIIYAVRNVSPMVAAHSEEGSIIASDLTAIISFSKDYFVVPEYHILTMTEGGIKVEDLKGNEVRPQMLEITWDITAAQKGGFPHFMLKEIYEQPESLRNTITPRIVNGMPDLSECGLTLEALKNYRKLFIVACGTAMHAGMVGKYVIEKLARTEVTVDIASEFRYRDPIITPEDLVIVVSQSGETADTKAALHLAHDKGAKVLSVVNVKGSSIARESDMVLYTHAGPEISVASTKAFSVQMSVMYLLAFEMAYAKGHIDENECKRLTAKLAEIPDIIEKTMECEKKCKYVSSKLITAQSLLYIGRGLDYALSMEGSLKLKEISYIHSESYAAGELKHGTISLVEDGMPVIGVATQTELLEKTVSNIVEVKSRGAFTIAVCKEGTEFSEGVIDEAIEVPAMEDVLMPMLTVIPLQLIAYYTTVLKGLNVDKPRNLAKSVTVE